ncbi:hypothetical protein ACG9Y7_03390 [Acinetobacter gerneri]|uniref:hypothetical protein n=1 Tax=Acinetobacter gerneri TaxID=202952 RepID=UPI003AF597CD
MINTESFEFIKGPIATLYGRGETGDLLNINNRKAAWESSSEINLRWNIAKKFNSQSSNDPMDWYLYTKYIFY